MRLRVSILCLLLAGVIAPQGMACQFSSLPALEDATTSRLSDEQSDVQSKFKAAPVVTPVDQSAVKAVKEPDGFSSVFENALSQFPQQHSQQRVAELPVVRQTATPTLDNSRFQERPTMRQSVIENIAAQKSLPNAVDQDKLIRQSNQFKSIAAEKQVGKFGALDVPADTPFLGDTKPISKSLGLSNGGRAVAEPFQWRAPPTLVSQPAVVEPTVDASSTASGSYPLMAPEPATDLNVPHITSVTPTQSSLSTPMQSSMSLPAQADDSITWWKSVVMQPLDGTRATEPVDANGLVYRALQSSPRIQAVSQNPLIRELQIVEADAEFDAVQFVRSQFEDRVDPVGNQLTVGTGESFLKDNIWSADVGFRKKARTGANWELNQRLGFQNSNSTFFDPQDQGTATLALNVTQPLLRGRGRYYNQSQIMIAQATNGAAWQTFHAELQDELLGVVSAYWDLYLSRSVYLQKQRNVERGQRILSRLEGRAGLDSLPSQIARARSSVQTRRTELANALRDVKNAETEVRRRIADNSWISGGGLELIPGELPSQTTFQLPLEQVVYSALQHRPEVNEAMNRVRIASIQRDVSANEILPELSLLMGTYVSALRGDTGILNAFQDQFGQVKPGYSFGVNFELPYGNRAARSRLAQRQLQVRKIRAEVDEVMQTVIAESQVALRRVESASDTLVAAREAIAAAHADRNQFERRWESFALVEGDLADGQNPTNVLDQLLDSQDRLASAELVFVQSERELKVAEVALQRAMGTLLMTQNIGTSRNIDSGVPRMDIFKDGAAMAPAVSEVPAMAQPQIDAFKAGLSAYPQ